MDIDLLATATKERKIAKCRKCSDSMDVRFYSVGGETYALYGACRCTRDLQDKIGMVFPMDESKITTHQKETADPSFPLSCTSCHSRVLQYEKWIDFNGGFWGSMVSKCEHTLDPNYAFPVPILGDRAPILGTAHQEQENTYSEKSTPVSISSDMELPLDNQQEGNII